MGRATEKYRAASNDKAQALEDYMRSRADIPLRQADPGYYAQDPNAKPMGSSEEDLKRLEELRRKAEAAAKNAPAEDMPAYMKDQQKRASKYAY